MSAETLAFSFTRSESVWVGYAQAVRCFRNGQTKWFQALPLYNFARMRGVGHRHLFYSRINDSLCNLRLLHGHPQIGTSPANFQILRPHSDHLTRPSTHEGGTPGCPYLVEFYFDQGSQGFV